MKVVTRRVPADGVSEVLASLEGGACGLWTLRPGEFFARHSVETSLSLLSPLELQRYKRFLVPSPAFTFLASRVLLRGVVSYLTNLLPAEIETAENEYGRPDLAGAAARSGLSFNLSHKPGMAVLLVALRRTIGVDVEDASKAVTDLSHIADRFFSPTESRDLLALPPEERQERFYRLWTLKESYIKARGMGLALGLSRFSFSFPDQQIAAHFAPELSDRVENWQFWQHLLDSDHMVAATIKRIEGLDCRVECWHEGDAINHVMRETR